MRGILLLCIIYAGTPFLILALFSLGSVNLPVLPLLLGAGFLAQNAMDKRKVG